jgi:hypothetical protein
VIADLVPALGLALRAEHDPDGVFLTRYWRDRLGLWA